MKRSLPPLVAGLLLQASAFSQSSAPSSAPMAPGSAGASAGTGPFDSRAGSSTADVRLHLLSPDEKRIVFLADAEQDEVVDLYVVKPTGSLVVKLSNPAFAPGSTGVVDFRITPDGRRVLYLADHAAPRRYELYSASIDGVGPVAKIARPRSTGQIGLWTYRISPDSRQVVYVDKETNHGPLDLFVAPLDGGPLTKLSRSAGSVLGGDAFLVSPDSQRVVYQTQLGNTQVFSTRLDGSTEPLLLATGPITFGAMTCAISPDSARLVYGGLSGEIEVKSVQIDGSAQPVALNGPLPPAGGRVEFWRITPDGARVVYTSNEVSVDTFQLHSAPIDGSTPPVQVSAAVGSQRVLDFQTSSAGRVAFLTRLSGSPTFDFQLESAPIIGGAAPAVVSSPGDDLTLDDPAISYSWGPLWRPTPGGTGLLFATTVELGENALFVAPIDGSGTPLRIADITPGTSIPHLASPFGPAELAAPGLGFDPIRRRVLYVEVELASLFPTARLFSAALDASSPALEISGTPPAGSEGVSRMLIAPRTGQVYYTADSLEPGVLELFVVPTDGSRPPRLLVDL